MSTTTYFDNFCYVFLLLQNTQIISYFGNKTALRPITKEIFYLNLFYDLVGERDR